MKHLPIVALACLSFASCKEVPVRGIDLGIVKPYDSTYVETGSVTVQPRNIVIEEFTGVKCVNCPQGHEKIQEIKNKLGDRVVLLSIQPAGRLPSLTLKYSGHTKNDNTTDDGAAIFDFLNGAGALPAACVDRVPASGVMLQTATPTWPGLADQRVALSSPVRMTLTITSYNSTTREAVITVKALYTESVTKQQYLTVAIKEDAVIDAQLGPGGVEDDYVHNNLLRDVITPATGQRILQAFPTIEKGRVYESRIFYKVADNWKPENCRIVAYVSKNDAGDKEVEQAAEVKLIP